MAEIVQSIDSIIINNPTDCSVDLNREYIREPVRQIAKSTIVISGKTKTNRKFTYTLTVHGNFSSEFILEQSEEEKLDSLLKEVTE